MNEPLLSVCLITYNHVNYIKEAIDGVLIQKVNFSWELIIADDYSTDGTREIILEYKKKYPDFIKLILQEKNVGAVKNWSALINAPRSKYIAYFEGDDYWTDPYKLQKQIDFLEKNHDFAICFHNMQITYENNPHMNRLSNIKQREVTTIETLARGNYIYTASCIFRKHFSKIPDWVYQCPVGDYPLHLFNAQYGKIKFIDDIMGVYRIHQGGTWGNTSIFRQREKWVEMIELMRDKFDISIRNSLNQNLCNCSFKLAQYYLKKNDYEKYNFYLMKIRNNHPRILFRIATRSLIVKYFFKTRGICLF